MVSAYKKFKIFFAMTHNFFLPLPLCFYHKSSPGYNAPTIAPTISLGSHQNIGLHTGARANVLLTYLMRLQGIYIPGNSL